MTGAYGKAVVIANPIAGKGWVGRDPSVLEDLLRAAGIGFELRLTSGRGHAREIARSTIEGGGMFLVAVGGDGTIHEVVNGMFDADPTPDAVLGILSAGSGSDFIRTFGLPQDPRDGIKHLTGENLFTVDIGKITYARGEDRPVEYFPNIAEAGLGADVVRRAERFPRSMGRLRYLAGFWMSLGTFKPTEGRVVLDERTYEGPITNLVVANAQFFGGGMRIAPKAHPADGKFDVLVQRGTKRDYVAGITKVYKGTHLPSPAIKQYLAARVEVTTEKPLPVEADGELLGTTPATFELLPEALKLKI